MPADLAEAHFRRALTSPAPGLADLEAAAKLKPADSRYRYHLALAHHRRGDLERAEPLYRELLAVAIGYRSLDKTNRALALIVRIPFYE